VLRVSAYYFLQQIVIIICQVINLVFPIEPTMQLPAANPAAIAESRSAGAGREIRNPTAGTPKRLQGGMQANEASDAANALFSDRMTWIFAAQGLWFWISLGLTVSTMRKRNGYRGLHEFLSGTRTFLLRRPEVRKRRGLYTHSVPLEVRQPEGLPATVGFYRILGALRWEVAEKTLLAEDVQLGRRVWIWLRPATYPPLNEALRCVDRTTRERWLACGEQAAERWDAFLAPTGCPLAALAAERGQFSWPEFRPILADLCGELQASCTEGSLPPALAPSQLWITPEGGVQLLSIPLDSALEASNGVAEQASPGNAGADPEKRVLAFLGEVTALALEGKLRPRGCPPVLLQAPIPLQAATLLNRLPGLRQTIPANDTLEQFQADLLATQDAPAEISRWMRTQHLLGQAIYVWISLSALTLLSSGFALLASGGFLVLGAIVLAICPCLFFLPAYLFRGGFSFYLRRIAIVRADGRPASRLRCLVRALLAWAFVSLVVGLAVMGEASFAATLWQRIAIPVVAVFLLAFYVTLMIRWPRRAPHDYVVGTYLVPK